MQYSEPSLKRALRAVRCSPFKIQFFQDLCSQRISLTEVVGQTGVSKEYTQRPLSELGADSDLNWLMQVGLLRREVDGQGLTDSFRLTPLGRQLLEQWQQFTAVPLGWWERLQNFFSRWLRLI